MGKYKCENCNWVGNDTINYDPYNDGGYEICPECNEQVILNWNNSENQLRFLKALFESK